MSSFASTLQSPTVQRRIFWFALLVLVCGIVAVVAVRLGNEGDVKPVDRQGVGVNDVAVRRPTLDDVFLTLTGHAAEDSASEADLEPAGAR